jgi:ABC-type amino acid transport system permease subunit
VGEKWFFPSAKGVGIPWISPSDGFWQWLIFVGIGVGASIWVYKWRMRLKDERGGETHAIAWGTATVVVFAVVGWFAHPLFGSLEFVWSGLASFFSGFPVFLMQIILAVGAVAIAAWWIKSFLDALRTGSGLAKLTDDDWFRVIFAGVMGVLAAGLFLLFSPIAELLLDGFVLLFEWLETRFALDNTSQPMAFSRPEVIPTGNFFNFGTSGIVITPGFFAVWVGVTIYTAAFIAEIVRGGILAVPKGQTEAAGALGLRRSQMLRLVILPQAFRIILPPLGNQYLNLAKNTSLGIAVAYPEIVQVGQTLYNQTGQSLPVVLVWMAFFLTVSLTISAVVNYFNRRMQLVER